MWTCPKCGGKFFQRNLSHSCTKHTEKEFLSEKPGRGITLYKKLLKEFRKIGPITLHVVKTRIALMVEVRFCAITTINEDFIAGHLWLKEKIESGKFYRIEDYTHNNFVHRFRIYGEKDIDTEFRGYMRMAYDVGTRKHIKPKKKASG